MAGAMPASLLIAVLTGSSLALVSSAHCAAMCGPLALASRSRHGTSAGLSYFAGRLLTYTILGALFGGAGRVLLLTPWARAVEAGLSWLLACTLLYTAVSLLRTGRETLLVVGKKPRVSRAGRMLAHVADDPLLLGAATALLPCGALFSALVAAATLGTASSGALALASFASITGVVVVGIGELARLSVHTAGLRRGVAVALLCGAALTAYRPLPMLLAKEGVVPPCHAPTGAVQTARKVTP
jgi:sulfite exporter TauE/SafE